MVTDLEFDDIVVLHTFAAEIPVIFQSYRQEKDGPPHGQNKQRMLDAFVPAKGRPPIIQYSEDSCEDSKDQDDSGLKKAIQILLDMPRSEKEPFLYLTIIGPCGRLVAAINETPVLSKMKKCILFYSGTYNLRNSGDLHKWCTDDQNVIIDMSRAVFFKGEPSLEGGAKQEPDALKNLCSLLGPEKSGLWATIKEKSPSKFKAFQAFQQRFNDHLVQPHKLFDLKALEKMSKEDQVAFAEYTTHLLALVKQDVEKYRQEVVRLFGDEAVEKKWVPLFVPKKWGSLLHMAVDSPIGDMVIPIFFYLMDQKWPMQVIQGQWAVTEGGWSVITPCENGHAYTVCVKDPEAVVPLVRQFVCEVFLHEYCTE